MEAVMSGESVLAEVGGEWHRAEVVRCNPRRPWVYVPGLRRRGTVVDDGRGITIRRRLVQLRPV